MEEKSLAQNSAETEEILRLSRENHKKLIELREQLMVLQKLLLLTFNEDLEEVAAND